MPSPVRAETHTPSRVWGSSISAGMASHLLYTRSTGVPSAPSSWISVSVTAACSS